MFMNKSDIILSNNGVIDYREKENVCVWGGGGNYY